MSDDDEVLEIVDPEDDGTTRGRGGRGRGGYRGRFPRRGDGTRRPFRGSTAPRRFRPPRRPFQGSYSSSSRGTYSEKSSNKDSYHYERHRSERRSRTRSRSRSPSRERRDRSRHYRSRHSRSHSRSRSRTRSRTRSKSRSPSRSSSRRSPSSRSRSSPSRRSDNRSRTSRSPPPRGAYIPKHSRYYVSDEVIVESPPTSSIVPKYRQDEQARSPDRETPTQAHRSLSPANPLESLRITVDNDYFGPTSLAVEAQPEMGRNNWNRNRDDRKEKAPTSSIQPIWKKRKVMGARDMDAFDDDVNYSRLASRASPPPPETPPSPPETKFKPVIKQEGKPRPGDVNIFNKINQSWDWSQKGSKFLEETPTFKAEQDAFTGFGSSDYKSHDAKPPLRSCLRKTEASSVAAVIKPEPREDSPPPLPKYNIPGLDLVNTDDEDEFLYGDASSSEMEKTDFLSNKTTQRSDAISVQEKSRPERSSSQDKDSQGSLEEYLKRIGLGNKSPVSTTSSVSEDAQQRALEIAKRVTEMFNSPRAEPAPAKEKAADPRLRKKPNQTSDPNASQASVPAQQNSAPSYKSFGIETVGNFNSEIPPSTASPTLAVSAEQYPNASPTLAVSAEQYPNYLQHHSVQPPNYPPQYNPAFYGGHPSMIPGLMPPPIHSVMPMPPYAMQPNSPYPPVQNYPQPPYQQFSMPTPMPTPTTSAPATPGWVSSLTPVQSTSSRSNLKVIELHGEGAPIGDGAAAKHAVSASIPGPKVEDVKMPTNAMERKKLLQERLETKKRLDIMNAQVEDCRKRQGELMRRKQRQKDGHNDPQLTKLIAAQDLYSKSLAPIKKKLESIDKALKASEFLARKPESSGSSSTVSVPGIATEKVQPPKEISKGKLDESTKSRSSNQTEPPAQATCRYIDNGNHWCKHCRDVFKLATDLLKHLHTKHLNVMDRLAPADRPWATRPQESISALASLTLQPFQGVEFMLPSQAFYCSLCCEFSGDLFEARNHLESEKHNSNHSKYCLSNPNYLRRVQTERASSIARKKEENRRKLTETLKDSKRKIEESLKDSSRQSKHFNMASSSRRRSRESSSESEDSESSSSKKRATSKTNIKINFLKKDVPEMEENVDRSYTISTPQSKIPFKLMGKGVSTSLSTGKSAKKPSAFSVDDQKAQRILSNLKKKRMHDKSERSEPLPLDDFVSIALESGLPADCRLPEKDVQTIMAAAKELRVTPKFLSKPAEKEYGPPLPPPVEIGPQLPSEAELTSQVYLKEESESHLPSVENILQPPPPPPPLSIGDNSNLEPPPPGVENTSEPLPPGVEINALPPTAMKNVIVPPPIAKPKSPSIMDFDAGNLDALSQILDAIPLPQELDDLALEMEESIAKESEVATNVEDVEMRDAELDRKPASPNTASSADVPIKKDQKNLDDLVDAEESNTKPTDNAGSSMPSDLGVSASVDAEGETLNDMPTLVIGSVTSLSETLLDEDDVQMQEAAGLSAKNVNAQADQESTAEQEPNLNHDKGVNAIDATSQIVQQPADSQAANRPELAGLPHVPETSQPEVTPRNTNYGSDVSTDENDEDYSSKVAIQPTGLVSASSVSLPLLEDNGATAPSMPLPLQEGDGAAALRNGQPIDGAIAGITTKKRPQLAICSRGRGRGRGRGIAKSLPSCSVVLKQETFEADELQSHAGKTNSSNETPKDDFCGAVIKQEPVSPPRDDTSADAKVRGRKVENLKVRVKQESGKEEISISAEKSGPAEKVELSCTLPHFQNLESSATAGDIKTPGTSTRMKKGAKGEQDESNSTEEKLDDALLEDEDTVGLPPLVSEGDEKLDDALLNDPESMIRRE